MSPKILVLLSLSYFTSAQVFRTPTPSDILPFLKATPIFPTFVPPILPQGLSNARVDYGVGLPGRRVRPYDGCSENRTLEMWDYGVLTTPKYPDDYFPSTACEWSLTAPEGSKIHATIFDIAIQPWFLNYFDALSLSKDGKFYAVDNYAGNQNAKTPFTVTSTNNSFGVRFKSDAIYNDRGFKLAYVVKPIDETNSYQAVDDGICGRPGQALPPTEAPSSTEATPTTEAPPTTEQTRIIGDSPAAPHSLPWMVAMLIDGKSFCGGSIIDKTHILTAAHCTSGAEHITILIGAHDIKNKDESGRLVVNVTKDAIFTHPKYHEENVFNDISIIRLPQELTYSSQIAPVCLPNRRYLAETFDQVGVTVSGWGLTADKGKISATLQKTNVTVLNNANCRKIFRDIVTGNNMCVSTTPTNSPCRGDSGGALTLQEGGEGDSYLTQVGIVSFGSHTCERGYPVAFTRVTAFLDYINSITGKTL